MEDPPLRILRLRLTYLLIVMLEVLFQTLPIHSSPYQFATPDIPLVITLVWVMRRPDVMDPILITIAFLFADMILQRPPGLWALVALCATMFLRVRALYFKEIIFFYEWLMIAIIIIISFTVHHFLLILTFLPIQNLELLAMRAFITIVLYPIFIWVFRSMLRFSLYNALQDAP
jgi:rod shape-determining protein MreD